MEWNHPGSGENAGGDQQGIAWQKKPNKQPGFNKHNQANQRRAASGDQLPQAFRVIKRVEEVENGFDHATWAPQKSLRLLHHP